MGSLHARNQPLWVETTGETDYPKLQGEVSVDVAVVGGGITGLTTATLLKERGVKVALVEAGRIVSGSTGYSTGKVTALHGLIYADLAHRIGDEAARVYAEANQAAIEQVASLVHSRGIDCEFERQTAYTYSERPERLCDIEAEVEAAQHAGLPATFANETALPFSTPAAIRLDDQIQFNPRKYGLALGEAVKGEGSFVFETTRALAVIEKNGRVEVQTDAGLVRADRAIVATLLPFSNEGEFHRKTRPNRSYLMAMKLDMAQVDGMYLSADRPVRTIRQAGDYVLIGGNHHPVGQEPDTETCYRDIEAWARARFVINHIVHRWSAQDYTPTDRIPYIGKPTPDASGRVLVATGFQKWGLSLGTAAAMLLRDVVLDIPNDWLPLFDASRRGYPAYPSEEHHAKHQPKLPATTDQLPSGSGAVFEIGGEKVAVYRDDDGKLHAVSAICTHLGCPVSFNTAERTWDCHCHGSRYHTDGRVIQGPAVRDLAPAAVTTREDPG